MKYLIKIALLPVVIALILVGCDKTETKKEKREIYYGTYNALTNCDTVAYVITISASDKGPNFIKIENIDAAGAVVFGELELGNSDNVEIPAQVVGNNTVSGYLNYTASEGQAADLFYNNNPADYYSCMGAITKQ